MTSLARMTYANGQRLEGAGQALHSIADLLDCYGDGLELSASQQSDLFHAVGIIGEAVKRTGAELHAVASPEQAPASPLQRRANAEGLHLAGVGHALHGIADLLDCYGDGLELSASQQSGLFHVVGIIADTVKRTGQELCAIAAPACERAAFEAAQQATTGA